MLDSLCYHLSFNLIESSLDRSNFDLSDDSPLRVADSVPVEDNSVRVVPLDRLEVFQSLSHQTLHLEADLLPDLVLDYGMGPVLRRSPVVGGHESNDRFTLQFCLVEGVHATDHRFLIEKRKLI